MFKRKLRKSIASILTGATVLLTVNAFALVPFVAQAAAGDLVKSADSGTVYVILADGESICSLVSEGHYDMWAQYKAKGVGRWQDVSTVDTSTYTDSGICSLRVGSLVRTAANPEVFVIQSGNTKRGFEAWDIFVTDGYGSGGVYFVTDEVLAAYTTGDKVTSATPVAEIREGQLVKYASSATVYYVAKEDSALVKREVTNEDAYFSNFGINWNLVITVPDTEIYTASDSQITGADTAINRPVAITIPETPVASTLTVALASDTPTPVNTLVSTTPANGAQAFIPVTKVNFTASSDGAAQVNTIKFKRGGVPSADTDFAEFYLYEGDTLLAEYSSISLGVLTFTKSTGLFTVPAGTTKSITLKVNLDKDATASRNYNFSVLAAADIVTASGTVSGTFPITGNTMATVTVTDLGKYTVAHSSYSTTFDPGLTAQTLWKISNAVLAQNVQIESMKFTFIGTISSTDLANFKLDVGGVQIGSTVAAMATDKTVTFDLASSPYKIDKGNTKYIELKGDIAGGTDRTFQTYIYNKEDIKVKDLEYGVYLTPNQADTYTKISAPAATQINAGSLTVGKSATSPSGNVALGATGVEFADFDFKATGEDIKVDTVYLYVDMSTSTGLYQVTLFVDGSQVGTAVNLGERTGTSVSVGNSFIIPAGTTKTLAIKADMKEADGTALTADETLTFQLSNATPDTVPPVVGTKSCDYTKQSSGGTDTTGVVSANVLAVKSGALTAAKNGSLANYSATNPTGVPSATNVKVASLVLTAGAGEDVTVTQIVVGDDPADVTYDFGDWFQNLKLKNGTTELSTTQSNLSDTAGADFSFSLSPSVKILKGNQYVVDVYADILSSATGAYADASVGLEFVSATATGDKTGIDASYSTAQDLQTIYISSTGTLDITADSATPTAGQLVMGSTDIELAKLQFTAGISEDINVSRIEISDTTTGYNGSLSNVKLYDGTTQIGSTVSTFDATNDAEFLLATDWVILKDTTKVLTIKASVNSYPNATSGGTITLAVSAAGDVDSRGAGSGSSIGETVTAATGNAQDIYRTSLVVDKGASSPTGSSVASGNATVLEFAGTVGTAYDAVLNTVAITMSGSVDMTGTASANLYKKTDLTTALATESYKSITASTTAGTTTTFYVEDGNFDGVPIGANIWLNDADATATEAEVVSYNGTTGLVTFTPAITNFNAGANFTATYYPLQPGTGKVYFGAQTTLGGDVTTGDTTITVSSTDGFATGDAITVKGYSATGTEVTGTGTIKSLTATVITLDSAITVTGGPIDYDYLNTAANAVAKGQKSAGIVYTTAAANSVNETIAAGSTKTFVVKGDTTGATLNENLRADIAAISDLNWDDTVNYGIITNTLNLPVTGGTLTY